MELLSYPRNEYLLDASLESLHADTQDWLKELEFWNDEMAFFYKLLHKKRSGEAFPAKDLAAMDKALIRISSEELDRVRSKVVDHEQQLMGVLKSDSLRDDQRYRETHRRLRDDMYHLDTLVRAFKKDVFAFYVIE